MLMLFAGLRRGEAAALDLDRDVDTGRGLIYVRQSVSYVVNQGVDNKPKSVAGERAIPIMPPLMPLISISKGFALPRRGNASVATSP